MPLVNDRNLENYVKSFAQDKDPLDAIRQIEKAAAHGVAELDASAKIIKVQGTEVWALADLTDCSGTTGSGSTVVKNLRPSITSPSITTSIVLASDNSVDIGTSSRRARTINVVPDAIRVYAAAGDAEPVVSLGDGSIDFGSGASATTDARIVRNGVRSLVVDDGAGGACNLTVKGNLTVSGTTTTLNSTVVDIKDRVVHVNHTTGTAPVPALITGIEVDRGEISGVPRDGVAMVWVNDSDVVDPSTGTGYFRFCAQTGGDDSTLGSDVPLHLTNAVLDVPYIDEFSQSQHDHADASGGGTLTSTAFMASSVTGTGLIVLATAPTIDTPAIDDFSSATHDHSDASNGGLIDIHDIDNGTGSSSQFVAVNTAGTALVTVTFVAGTNIDNITITDTTITVNGATDPTILDYSNAQHDHSDASNGGLLSVTDLDIGTATTNQVLGVNAGGSGVEGKTITAGTGISVTHAANQVTITNTGKPASYSQAFGEFYADGTNNNCDSIREWDNTAKCLWHKITALASGSPLQSLQVVFPISLPTGFTDFASSTAIEVSYQTSGTTAYVQVMGVIDSGGTLRGTGLPAAAQSAAKATLTVTKAMLAGGTWTPDTVVYAMVKGYGNTGTPFSTETAKIGLVKANFA